MEPDLIVGLFFIAVSIVISALTGGFDRKSYTLWISLLGVLILIILGFVIPVWWLGPPIILIVLYLQARITSQKFYEAHSQSVNLRKEILKVSIGTPLVTILILIGILNIWVGYPHGNSSTSLWYSIWSSIIGQLPPLFLFLVLGSALGFTAGRNVITKYHVGAITSNSERDGSVPSPRMAGDSTTDAPSPDVKKKKKGKGK